jgi:hypothetical protein
MTTLRRAIYRSTACLKIMSEHAKQRTSMCAFNTRYSGMTERRRPSPPQEEVGQYVRSLGVTALLFPR